MIDPTTYFGTSRDMSNELLKKQATAFRFIILLKTLLTSDSKKLTIMINDLLTFINKRPNWGY